MSDDRWLRCRTCAGYYDQSDADQWMLDTGRDVEDGKDGNDLEYPFERHCPECVDKLEEHVRNEEEICGLRDQVVSMRNQRDKALARVDTLLRERTAAPAVVDLTSDEPAAKKRRAKAQSVWVLHKGDWPCEPNAQLVNIEVLGTYSSRANAEAALEEFLEEGGWQEGYGYHNGADDGESNIQIAETELDAPALYR